MSALSIRAASAADVPTLRGWDEKPHVRAATSNDGSSSFGADWEDELGARDDGTEILIAEVDGFPIGAMQIVDPATERSGYWGDVATNLRAIDIWIGEEAYIGRGHGTRMMEHAIERCLRDARVDAILVDPLTNNVRAHAFYARLGFELVERRRFDDGSDCFVFSLSRERWDKCRSPSGTASAPSSADDG